MQALRSLRKLLAGTSLAAFVVTMTPGLAHALPRPGQKPTTFKLMARAISFININRVYMGINNIGNIGVDTSGSGQTQGGYWPRGTPDNYVFNSGLQVAGIIQGDRATNPWAGDTAGGWFFDGAGGRQQTEGLTPVYSSTNPDDAANWPADAYVPQGDDVADLYAPALQGLVAASQDDVHFLAWEGNPKFSSARVHPLGILIDWRVMAWNYPAGAQDIVFLVATVYNVTSANASDYAAARPGIRQDLINAGQLFQQENNAQFHITLPVGGYTVGPMYIGMAGDNDVGNAGDNYNGGILPFAMGYTYEGEFDKGTAGWTFDPTIFAPPFFAGVGFVGYKYLKGPDGPGKIQLLTTFCNGNCGGTSGHADPGSTVINFRLLAGTPAPTDGQCDTPGIPAQTHLCFMLFGANAADTRIEESSSPLTLGPGEDKTIVVAYVYAAPVLIPGFIPGAANGNLDPGNPYWSSSLDSINKYNGLNKIDSISGFTGYIGPQTDGDGSPHVPTQSDFGTVKGSLLGKALVAQAVFDVKFLQEFAPDAPNFFLIPGDKQVTILWKPSDTETIGDPYFAVVSNPQETDADGNLIPNPLYDPNYRKFDVEGYRIYRGRSDTPSALKLLVQFDYAGTTFKDYTGVVENGNCAPEIGVLTDCPVTFPTPSNPTPPGTAPTVFQTYNIGPQTSDIGALSAGAPLVFVDQTVGNRVGLAGGTTSLTTVADTAVSGGGSGFPALADTGVPFIFIDKAGAPNCSICGVANGVTYFYSVTAFDVNAPGHGPTSLESARITKQVIPGATGANYINTATTQSGVFGRSGLLTDNTMPTINATTGEFSKKFPPATGAKVALAGFAQEIITGSGSVGLQFDSSSVQNWSSDTDVLLNDYYELLTPSGSTKVTLPFHIPPTSFTGPTDNGSFVAFAVDSTLAAPYAGTVTLGSGYQISATYAVTHNGAYAQGLQTRGCANGVPGGPAGDSCYYQGPRWFQGANESTPNPTTNSPANQAGGLTTVANWGNAGSLPGVATVHNPNAYGVFTGSNWRNVDYIIGSYITAADYNVYWGASGKIDSVVDMTHDEPVAFSATMGNSWGILNSSTVAPADGFDGRAELTAADFVCVPPLKTFNPAPGCPGPAVALVQTAVPGPVAFAGGATTNLKTVAAAPNNGFGMYLHGRVFIFELTGGTLPTAGTVWTMRDYTGSIYGGNGEGGNEGTYAFVPSPVLPMSAPGAQVKFAFSVVNHLVSATSDQLSKVHTVPDPYYVTSAYDISVDSKLIEFVNVPIGATIRIYSSSGVLLRVLTNSNTNHSGIVKWDVRNRTNQFVSSGVYFYNVEAGGVNHTGRMTIVNYASTVQ